MKTILYSRKVRNNILISEEASIFVGNFETDRISGLVVVLSKAALRKIWLVLSNVKVFVITIEEEENWLETLILLVLEAVLTIDFMAFGTGQMV